MADRRIRARPALGARAPAADAGRLRLYRAGGGGRLRQGFPRVSSPCRTPPSSSARARLPRISPTTTWSPSTGNWPRSSPATRRCRATTMRWASPAVARAWPTGVSGSSSRTVAERDVSVGEFIDRLRPQLAKVPGIMLYLRAAQDINLSSGPSRTQYQYALRSMMQHPAGALGATPHRAPEAGAGADGCVQRPAGRRQRHRAGHRPGGRGAFRPQRRGCQPDPLRRLRPAPGRRVPDRGQPVQGGPRTRCAPARPRGKPGLVLPALAAERRDGPAVGHRQGRGAALRAAADQPQRHVPGGQPVLQPGCRGVPRRGGAGGAARQEEIGMPSTIIGVFRARRRPSRARWPRNRC